MKYSLLPDGKTLTVAESITGSGKKRENTWVLNREAPPTLDVTETNLAEIKAAGQPHHRHLRAKAGGRPARPRPPPTVRTSGRGLFGVTASGRARRLLHGRVDQLL